MTTEKPLVKRLGLDMPPEMQASLVERAKREGITPVQALKNSLSIGMEYARSITTYHEGGYSNLSPQDARKLARLTWL